MHEESTNISNNASSKTNIFLASCLTSVYVNRLKYVYEYMATTTPLP